MPIKFKTSETKSASEQGFASMNAKVRAALNLPDDVQILYDMKKVYLSRNGVTAILPMGFAAIKNDPGKLSEHAQNVVLMFANIAAEQAVMATLAKPQVATAAAHEPSVAQPPAKPYSDMSDDEWVQAVVGDLFPGFIPLQKCDQLYQTTMGTSSGSLYRVAFVGPHLRVACRIKGSKVSFRATTNEGKAPQGEIKDALMRLGVTTEYGDRMTVHCSMTGPYGESTSAEYRALFGAFYGALRPFLTSNFPAISKFTEGVK